MYGAPPPARGGHASISTGNLVLTVGGTFYGGDNRFEYLNDVWALNVDANKWQKLKCTGKSQPGPRYGHAIALVGTYLYLFGGKGEAGIIYNDLWRLDMENSSWELMQSSSAAPPNPRFGHSMIAAEDALVVFGGWEGKTADNQVWLFDLST